jgi:DNA modification methylase
MSCIEGMAKLPDKSIDMIFTDPPYGHNNNNNRDLISRREEALGRAATGAEGRPIINDGAVEAATLFSALMAEAPRLLSSGGCCCCCGGGGGPDPQVARWSLAMDEALEFKHMVVWDKGPMGMGWHYRRSYETILVAMKPGAPCRWYDETNAVENVIRKIPKIIPRKDQHPTEKPPALAAHFIRLHSKPGDLILDPFAGSSSTLKAAREMGRLAIGFELDPQFIAMSKARLKSHQLSVFP